MITLRSQNVIATNQLRLTMQATKATRTTTRAGATVTRKPVGPEPTMVANPAGPIARIAQEVTGAKPATAERAPAEPIVSAETWTTFDNWADASKRTIGFLATLATKLHDEGVLATHLRVTSEDDRKVPNPEHAPRLYAEMMRRITAKHGKEVVDLIAGNDTKRLVNDWNKSRWINKIGEQMTSLRAALQTRERSAAKAEREAAKAAGEPVDEAPKPTTDKTAAWSKQLATLIDQIGKAKGTSFSAPPVLKLLKGAHAILAAADAGIDLTAQ